MNTINHHINPFSDHFHQSLQDFKSLSLSKKVSAVAAAILGALVTPYLLCIGAIATFQLAVKWLKPGDCLKENTQNNISGINRHVNRRAQQIAELERLLHLTPDERLENAVAQGYRNLTPEISSGFSGMGFQINGYRTYQGKFVDGQQQGHGIMFSTGYRGITRFIYKGEMADNNKNGHGLEVSADRSWYEGEFVKNYYQGKGTFRLEKESVTFTGNFKRGYPDGDVKITWDCGDRFEGTGKLTKDFNRYQFKGHGILTTSTGESVQDPLTITFDDGYTVQLQTNR